MGTATYLDLLTQAAGELNIVALGDDLSANPNLAQRLLDRLTMMVDSWNIKPTVVPWYQQQIFNLVPGKQTYLIGPNAPDWNAPRPIRLNPNAANLLLTNPANLSGQEAIGGMYPGLFTVNGIAQGMAPYTLDVNSAQVGGYPIQMFINSGAGAWWATGTVPVRIPLTVLSVEQWANISLPLLPISFPSGCYLDRSMVVGTNPANGQPYTATNFSVWGIPTNVNQIELFYWYQLTVGNLTDNANAPPGYFRAMFLNLALEIAPSFGIMPSAFTVKNAADALGDIKELNAPDMRIQPDPGMPTSKNARYITRAQFLSGNF